MSVCALAASAQWLDYPTAGVPRNPDGSPNLTAPAPKTPGGQPDFSGIWGNLCNTAGGTVFCAPEIAVLREFANLNQAVPGGLPYQPWAAQLVQQRQEQFGKDDPYSHCLPGGVARLHTSALYRKIVQTPGLLLFLGERNASYRQVFLDGRPLPKDPNPAWNGYSTARWEGDTLVVQTAGFRAQWLDRAGSPITEAAQMTERFRRPNYGTLEIEFTVDDPEAYTRPWTVRLKQGLVLDTELLDAICLENERDAPHLVGKE